MNRPSTNSSVRGAIAAARASQSSSVGFVSAVMPRSAAGRPRRARSRGPARRGRGGRRRDRAGPARASMKSRRSAVQPGGSYGILDERPAADPRRDVEVGQQPDPVGPGVRAVPAVAGERQLADRPPAEHPGRKDDVGLVDVERVRVERGDAARRRFGSSRRRRCARRATTPEGRPGPRRSVPASGSSSHSTSYAASRTAICAGRDRVQRRRGVAGHPPALVEVDHDRHRIADRVARRGHRRETLLEPVRVDPDLERPEALVAAGAAPIRPARPAAAATRTRRRPGCPSSAPPNSVATGSPATLPMTSHSATSSGQYRPAWKSIVSSVRTWRAMASGSCPTNRCSNASKPSIVSPDPTPTTPSSVSTRTIVAANERRGCGSQAAANGGSSGTISRSRRMAVMRTARVSRSVASRVR